MATTRRRRVRCFHLQSTKSFPETAPQREEYYTDEDHLEACRQYGIEWRATYICEGHDTGAAVRDCPQHGFNAQMIGLTPNDRTEIEKFREYVRLVSEAKRAGMGHKEAMISVYSDVYPDEIP